LSSNDRDITVCSDRCASQGTAERSPLRCAVRVGVHALYFDVPCESGSTHFTSMCRASRGPRTLLRCAVRVGVHALYFKALQFLFECVVTVCKSVAVNCFMCPADSVTAKKTCYFLHIEILLVTLQTRRPVCFSSDFQCGEVKFTFDPLKLTWVQFWRRLGRGGGGNPLRVIVSKE